MGIRKTIILILSLVSLVGAQNTEKKEVISPVVKSLILPGWGEKTLGNANRSRFFSLTETALWVGAAGTWLAASYEEDNFRSYAAEYAGVDVSSKKHSFWVDIGNYLSRDEYNEEHLRFRENDELYPETSEWAWVWHSDSHRSKFESMRIRTDSFKKTTSFLIGGVVINHIASAIDAFYLRNLDREASFSMTPKYNPVTDGVEIALSIQF